jgi:hypothetical protein
MMTRLRLTTRLTLALRAGATLGLVTLVIGVASVPERAWPNYLISLWYATGIGLGAGFFIATQYVTNAGWSVAIRRVPEALTSILPVAGVAAIGLVWGIPWIYEWGRLLPPQEDSLLQGKAAWLSAPFFFVRIGVYFATWVWLARVIARNSVRQDADGDAAHTTRNVRWSAVFLVVGISTGYLASIDLLMSLEPRWVSAVFGLASLSGSFLSGLAAIALLVVVLRRMGHGEFFTTEHLCDLGRLMMAFSVFWVYLWVSQHLVIWYGNLPEETSYYVLRHSGGWGPVSFLNVMLNWTVPFVLLLPRASKRSDRIVAIAAAVILAGRWLDLYVIVMPIAFPDRPAIGVFEVAPVAGTLAAVFMVAFRSLGKRSLVPLRDPYIVESLPRRSGGAFE